MVTLLDIQVTNAIARVARESSDHAGGVSAGYRFEQEVFRALESVHSWEHCAGPDHFDMALDLVGKSGTHYEFDGAFLSGDTLYVVEAKKVGVLGRQHVGILVQKLLDILLASREHFAGIAIKPVLVSAGPKIDAAAWLHAVSWGILLVSPHRPTPLEILDRFASAIDSPDVADLRGECDELIHLLWRPIDRLVYPSAPRSVIYHIATDKILDKGTCQQVIDLWQQCITRFPSGSALTH
jgi:hypothetical protein